MPKKIDISPLDKKTKEKIKALSKLSRQMFNGIPITINVPIKTNFIWDEGFSGYVQDIYQRTDWNPALKEKDKIERKYNKEVKEIIKFSDSIAKKLGVDKDQFWHDYFA